MRPLDRLVSVVATSVLAATALAGCSVLFPFGPKVSADGKPAVGSCWTSTFDTVQNDANWTSGPPVACAFRHQLYTFGVTSVYSKKATWATSDGSVDDLIDEDAWNACTRLWGDFLPDVDSGGRISQYYFLPSEAQWKKGARWVRCDVGVLRTGSNFQSPDLAALPANISVLTSQAKKTPDLFADCVLTTDRSGDTGPYDDPHATVADCTGDYQWRFESSFRVPGDQSDPYPSDDVLSRELQSQCGDAAEAAQQRWTGYVPTADDWANGNHWGECWYYRDKVPQT